MDKSIHVILGIDMETDCGHNTPFYEGVQKATPILLDIFEKKGVKTTFYFTGDAARQNPASVELVRGCGHDIGCHSLYHETVGEELYPIPGVKPLLPGEVFHRLETATQWVEEVSGTRPVSFRGPRLWGSTEVVNALEKLGYTSDATYPMYYFRQRFTPYHPSSRDWTQKGELKLLEIPNFADMLMESRDQPTESDRDQWPIFRTEGADEEFPAVSGASGPSGCAVLLLPSVGVRADAARVSLRRKHGHARPDHHRGLRRKGLPRVRFAD